MTHFVIPCALNIPSLLEKCGYVQFNNPIIIDKLHYIISLLVRRHALSRKADQYFSLKAEYIRYVIGKRFGTTAKGILISLGVLETNGSYQVGVRSLGYRLSEFFRCCETCKVAITDKKLIARIAKHRRNKLNKVVKRNRALEAIAHSLDMIEVDFTAADRYIERTNFLSHRAKETRITQLQAIRESDFYLSTDRQGRVHHNFVALCNDLKRFSTIRGEALYSVDVGNMQPALLSLFYKEECDEKTKYVELIRGNKFYLYFNERLTSPYDMNKEAGKKAFKQLLFRKILFCHNAVEHELGSIFSHELPLLACAIKEVKKGFHKRLARRLQQIEASIVIGEVIEELAKAYPQMPLLSAHDCIITTGSFVEIAKNKMEERFALLLGFKVPINSKLISVPSQSL